MNCREAVLFVVLAAGADDVGAAQDLPGSGGTTTELEEVVVEAGGRGLNALRREMEQLEDAFYRRYNVLNTHDDFDVHCRHEVPTGARIARRNCRAVYAARALQTEGVLYGEYLQSVTAPGGAAKPAGSAAMPEPASVVIEARRQAFRHNMLEVLARDAVLRDLLRRRAELSERYRAVHAEVFGAPRR